MDVKITEVTNRGNVYLLTKGNRIRDNSDEVNEAMTDGSTFNSLDGTMDETPDFGVNQLIKASCNTEVEIAEIKLLEDVFDFMVEAYENAQESNQAERTDFSLDPCIKYSVKNIAKEILAENSSSESIFDKVFDIVKCSIRVIYMSDDCSLLESRGCHKGIERKVFDYVNQKRSFAISLLSNVVPDVN